MRHGCAVKPESKRCILLILSYLTIPSYGLLSDHIPRAEAATCSNTSTGNVPLVDLGAGTYQGYQGGLYPGGLNTRPANFEATGMTAARSVEPLNGAGAPDPSGKIALMSMGMSNTSLEFSAFIPVANADPVKNPRLVLVNGAQGGQDAVAWADPSAPCWSVAEQRLQAAGVTVRQVEVVWLKQSIAGEQITGPFPTDAERLQGLLQTILANAKARYPNLKIVYVSNRIYAGYGGRDPFAYWTGFSVKWLVEANLAGNPSLPWTAWGPYLWADGQVPRSDGLTWICSDFQSDGIHPAPSGQDEVVQMLLAFFKNDTTAIPWFRTAQSAVSPQDPLSSGARLIAWPNPAREAVFMRSSDPRQTLGSVDVYDSQGRVIRHLPGFHAGESVTWDRRDDSGRRVPRGIYILRGPGATPAKIIVGS